MSAFESHGHPCQIIHVWSDCIFVGKTLTLGESSYTPLESESKTWALHDSKFLDILEAIWADESVCTVFPCSSSAQCFCGLHLHSVSMFLICRVFLWSSPAHCFHGLHLHSVSVVFIGFSGPFTSRKLQHLTGCVFFTHPKGTPSVKLGHNLFQLTPQALERKSRVPMRSPVTL